MNLEGIHHVTAITGDAPGNVDFYTRVLGLRLVKKSVNQDDPTVYHLFYADEAGSAGSDITFFEYPGARRGRAGRGMVHTVVWRVGSADAVAFWEERLKREGVEVERDGDRLTFADPEGLGDGLGVVAGVVLAVSSFTGWYTGEGEGVTISVLGWNTGVLGKLVLFAGLAVVVVLLLRELGVEPPAALPQSLLTIALGALATIFVLVRVISVPDDFFFAHRGVGLWISLAAALAVIVAGLLQASEEM